MEPRMEADGTYRVLPEGSQPCIWMVAGLLTYRLCDRDYDCERCPLDAALRGGEAAGTPGEAERSENLPAWGIRDGLSYHRVYGWLAQANDRRLRWGVDGVTARLLDHVSEIILPAVGTDLTDGAVACWAHDDGELVPLRSPVSGRVVRTNGRLQDEPALLVHAPYDEGWLMEIEEPARAGEARGMPPGLIGAEERRRLAAVQMKRFHRSAMGYLHMAQDVGPTSQDGGSRVTDLRKLLGPARYHRLVFLALR